MLTDEENEIIKQLEENNIKELLCTFTNIKAFKKLAHSLKTNTSLVVLYIANLELGPELVQQLSEGLKENHTLLKLGLTNLTLDLAAIEALAEALQYNSSIIHLDLTAVLVVEGMNLLIEALKNNSAITCLNLSRAMLTHQDQVKQLVEQAPSITSLNLSYNDLDDELMEHLAPAIQNNTTITSLNLSHNTLDSTALLSLPQNALAYLELSYNLFENKGIENIPLSLYPSTSLTHLNISNNYIEDQGRNILETALQNNPFLTSLYLDNIDLDAQKIEVLDRGLQNNTSLRKLSLSDNQLNAQMISLLAPVLQNNPSITYLDLSSNKLDAHTIKPLIPILYSYSYLSLKNNQLGNREAIELLVPVLQKNFCLTSLDLSHNGLSTELKEYLMDILQNNCSIIYLNLSDRRQPDPNTLNVIIRNQIRARTLVDAHYDPNAKMLFNIPLTKQLNVLQRATVFNQIKSCFLNDDLTALPSCLEELYEQNDLVSKMKKGGYIFHLTFLESFGRPLGIIREKFTQAIMKLPENKQSLLLSNLLEPPEILSNLRLVSLFEPNSNNMETGYKLDGEAYRN